MALSMKNVFSKNNALSHRRAAARSAPRAAQWSGSVRPSRVAGGERAISLSFPQARRMRVQMSAAEDMVVEVDEPNEDASSADVVPGAVNLRAEKAFGIAVTPLERSVQEYVTLPAKNYSVLDSDAVKKVGENTFRVSGGKQKFLMGQSGEPVGIIEIEVKDNCVVQRLVEAQVENAKGKAMVEMNNVLKGIKFECTVGADMNETEDEALLTCRIAISGVFTDGIMSKIPEERLNPLVEKALTVVLPWFLSKLKDDYSMWASGSGQRGADGKGEMQKMTAGIMNSLKTGEMPEGVVELELL